MSAAPLYVSLNLAYLPGVGAIENPEPQHYARAINYLQAQARAQPQWRGGANQCGLHDPRLQKAAALSDTLRRIVWTRAQREGAV